MAKSKTKVKKTESTTKSCCIQPCWSKVILAILIIVFVWVSPMLWSKILATIFAIVIFLLSITGSCCCKK